jgi:hypothetical protein
MNDIQKIIKDFISGDAYTNTTIHYDMNTIKIRLYENHSLERCIFFYIYSPWRITKKGKLINSSDLYTHEDEFEDRTKFKEAFAKYIKTTEELCKHKVVDVKIQSESTDLVFKWTDGTILESFGLNPHEWSYHIYDKINGQTYDVFYGKISQVKTKKKKC